VGVRRIEPGTRVGGIAKDRVGLARSATTVAGWPVLQIEAGVMERSDGADLTQAVKPELNTTEATNSRLMILRCRENISGL
jgi:hypothetical protein